MEPELVVTGNEQVPKHVQLEIVGAGRIPNDDRGGPFGRPVGIQSHFADELLVRVGEIEGLIADLEAVDPDRRVRAACGRHERIRDDLAHGSRVHVEAPHGAGARVSDQERVAARGFEGRYAVEEDAVGEVGDFGRGDGGAAGGEAGHVELPDGIGARDRYDGREGKVASDDVEDIGAEFGDA